MKVLIAVDGSEGCHEAVRQAGALISSERDRVCFYYSVPPLHVRGSQPLASDVMKKTRAALADAIFEAARHQLPAAFQASAETFPGHHDPRRGLSSAAEECHADMIAVGARGISPLRHLLLGSVSRAAVQAARVPVLVARKNSEVRPEGFRVLLAHDLSSAGDEAGKFLAKLSLPADAVTHIVTVTESIVPDAAHEWIHKKIEDPEIKSWIEQGEATHQKQKRQLHDELKARRSGAGKAFDDAIVHVEEGHPAQKILDCIRANSIDLVVLGARRQSGFARLVLGSTSESVLSHAPCSVLVVREHEQP